MINETKKFSLATKSIFVTYPRCEVEKEVLRDFLITLGADKLVVARENHEDGTPHLHAYAHWEKQKRFSEKTLDLLGHHPNIQSCKNIHAVLKYVKKDGNYLEHNMKVDAIEEAKKSKKSVIATELMMGKKTLREAAEENPELLFQYGTLKKNLELYKIDCKQAYEGLRECYWIKADPGKGKSQWARRKFPGLYEKPQNKWWDGYQGEETVLMEDVDTNALGHYLKIWGDNYACKGEVKGGTIPLMHKRFIVTSNYFISELWKEDRQMVEAIARRFKTWSVKGDYENGYELEPITGYILY